MNKILVYLTKALLILILFSFNSYKTYGEESQETESIFQQLQILQKDIKTLEKAVYSQPGTGMSSSGKTSNSNDDVLTQHLLKLSDLEEQFKILTNSFEEINFKLDKLSNRITKVQTDNQIRFQDLEKSGLGTVSSGIKKLPGSGEAQDLGTALGIPKPDETSPEYVQRTESIESVGTVVTETAERAEKILPETSPEEQYKFAISFLKVGDYETAEFALREFVDVNPKHDLA